MTQLFNTILQDLPLGAVLVLEVGNEEPFISRPINGAPELGEKVTEHLLDGQQRMTALWRGLCNNYVDRKYFLVVRSNQESGLPYVVDSVARSRKLGEVRAKPYWADEPLEQWSRRMVPLELCAPDLANQGKFREWARTAVADTQEREVLSEQIAEVRQKFASFNVPFLSLPVKTRKEVALDVFIKMNTSGVELTTFDVLVAQLEAELGQSLHELVAKLRAECPAVADYYSIARGFSSTGKRTIAGTNPSQCYIHGEGLRDQFA